MGKTKSPLRKGEDEGNAPGNCEAACCHMQKHGPKATALDSIPFIDCPRASQGKSGDDAWHFAPKSSAVKG